MWKEGAQGKGVDIISIRNMIFIVTDVEGMGQMKP
jgi:hypothetical protein